MHGPHNLRNLFTVKKKELVALCVYLFIRMMSLDARLRASALFFFSKKRLGLQGRPHKLTDHQVICTLTLCFEANAT